MSGLTLLFKILRHLQTAIEEVLDADPPVSYDRVVFKEKCESVVELIVDFAATGKRWAA